MKLKIWFQTFTWCEYRFNILKWGFWVYNLFKNLSFRMIKMVNLDIKIACEFQFIGRNVKLFYVLILYAINNCTCKMIF